MSDSANGPKPFPTNAFEFAAEEREHLHDVANPLAIATGMLEAYREELARNGKTLSETEERKLAKAQVALERIATLIRDRRTRMMSMQEAAKK